MPHPTFHAHRASWLVCAAAVSLAIAARMPAVWRAEWLFDSDNALGPLMAQAIASGGYTPLMMEGQDYLGAFDAYLAAPLAATLGHGARAWAVAQLGLYALAVIPLGVALGQRLGGAWGAAAAGLVFASGAPELLELTTCPPLGYVSNLALGIALILVGGAGVTTWPRALALGVLGGLGWWNNPQFTVFLLAVGLSLGARSALAAAGARTGPAGVRAIRCLLAAAALWVVLILYLPALFGEGPVQWGPLKFRAEHQPKYLRHALAGCAAIGFTLELLLRRGRLPAKRVAAALAGVALGAAPLLAYRWGATPTGVVPWMRYRPDLWRDHIVDIAEGVSGSVVGALPTSPAFAATCAAALLGLLLAHRSALERLLRLHSRGLPLPLVAIAPGAALGAVMLVRGGWLSGPRHYLTLLVPCAALCAWAAGQLARRHRALAAGLLAVIAVHGLAGAAALPRHLATRARPDRDALLRWLSAEHLTDGYGQYWVAFELSLVGHPLRIACDFDPMGNLHRFPRWKAELDGRRGPYVELFELSPRAGDEGRLAGAFDRRPPIRERRRFEPSYLVLRRQRE